MKVKAFLILILCFGLFTLSSCGGDDKPKEEEAKESEAPSFYSVGDIVINPAGTGAQKVMLVSVALQLKNEEEVKSMGEREALVKDVIVGSLSSKTIGELTATGYKDSLKVELKSKLKSRLRNFQIKDIYFTKYIIQ